MPLTLQDFYEKININKQVVVKFTFLSGEK